MRWNNRDELTEAIEELDTTVHAGAPIAFSVLHCFAMVRDVVDLVWPELDRLRALVADLPDMQPGDSVRVTLKADGSFDVVPLRSVEVDTTFDTFVLWQDTHGDSSKASWLTVWADAPERENDR